jgi:spermidine synthase
MTQKSRVFIGLFIVALSTLALEITLTRLLSVITWYHLAFFAISLGMLGMTAGAVTVYLLPQLFVPERLTKNLAFASLAYAVTIPLALMAVCYIPLRFNSYTGAFAGAILAASAPAVPFYFSGIIVSAILTKSTYLTGKIYAVDLAGASLGCLLVLAGLEVMDAPGLIILCGALGALASIFFHEQETPKKHRILSYTIFILLLLFSFGNQYLPIGIRPAYAKEVREHPRDFSIEQWNSFSRITVGYPERNSQFYWGKSPAAPPELPGEFHFMRIDGEAATALNRFTDTSDIEFLRYDVTNIAYELRPRGGACIIGVGGGRDLQSAVLFGHEKVVGIDINPIFIGLLSNQFRQYAGLADRPGVSFVVDEARSYLSKNSEQYSILQMSLIDTWAATAAGAFSLSENALYTVEAWQIFFQRLKPDGIFTVSRWYNPENLGETGRLVSLAAEALRVSGKNDPAQHLVLVTVPHSNIATLLVSNEPFSSEDLALLKTRADSLHYVLSIVPGQRPSHEILARILSANSLEGLKQSVAAEPMNFIPPTDENPYFFNMLRLGYVTETLRTSRGVLSGNITATFTLIVLVLGLMVLCIVTIAVPLLLSQRKNNGSSVRSAFWAGAVYFSLIGIGFMALEIALIQRLSVFLGHPIYALGVLLFTLILSAGAGSYASTVFRFTKAWHLTMLPMLMIVLIWLEHSGLIFITQTMITSSRIEKIVLSIVLIAPAGMLMGFFFPTGMKLASRSGSDNTPWYWALNGIFGVFASAAAVFISIYYGISTNFVIAAVCYAGCLPCYVVMWKQWGVRTPAVLHD